MPATPSPFAPLSTPLRPFPLPGPRSDSLPSLYRSQMINQRQALVNEVSLKGRTLEALVSSCHGKPCPTQYLRMRKGSRQDFDLTASPLSGAVLTVHQLGKCNASWAGDRQEGLPPVHCCPLFLCFALAFPFCE